jgi:uroporphyrinogen III methyltransferase/synthase
MKKTDQLRGRVYLVGAGPGDPGLITLRGLECLQLADVILYDYLVNPRILARARPEAEKICLGQHGRNMRIWSQEDIHDALIHWARQDKQVVRLKGGDPAVFAHGAEEIEVLQRAGVPFEVVPGITAALAAGSHAGIPITHRRLASAVALVTGHEDADKTQVALDYVGLAAFPGTLVFYMGVTTSKVWSRALMDAGKPGDTPAAIVRRCSLPDQRIVRCRLDEVADRMEAAPKIRPPAVVIVGPVAGLRSGPSWFEQRPLFGRRVLVTRPIDQADELANRLGELGAEVLVQPAIRITAPANPEKIDDTLRRLADFDWLVFSSANGVRFLLERLLATGRDLRALGTVRLAAIGPGTADELSRFHLRADLLPDDTFRAESLAEALVKCTPGQRCLLARASRGREVLAETLRSAGWQVEQLVVYESSDVETADPEITAQLAAGRIDWVTVTSSAIARSLFQLFGESLRQTRLVSISPVTSETIRSVGLVPAAEAETFTMAGVVSAILASTSP